MTELGNLLGGERSSRRIGRSGFDPPADPADRVWGQAGFTADRDRLGRLSRWVGRAAQVPVAERLVGGGNVEETVFGVRGAAEYGADRKFVPQ